MFKDLSCVIARVPSYFISEGLIAHGKSQKPSGTSCWSYHGEEIPFAPYNFRKFNVPEIILKEKDLPGIILPSLGMGMYGLIAIVNML